MVHLLPLPGSPLYRNLREVREAALRDAAALVEGGAAAIMIENFGDRPFFKRAPAETVAAMARIAGVIRDETSLPIGINVLRNDGASALAVAAATEAAFIRVNVLTGAMLTDQGLIEGDAAELQRERMRLAPHVAVFADHMVKHAAPIAPFDPVQSAKDLRLRGLADAVILSGKETGSAVDAAFSRSIREAIDAPLLIGSGLAESNAAELREIFDGAIVGTSIKENGDVSAPVDAVRVRAIVDAFAN